MNYTALHFIEEPIEPIFEQTPGLEKKPPCPQGFHWRGQKYSVAELLSEWHDYARRGKMARNMQPQHAATAARHGSWGVGVFYFRVRVEAGQVFDIYYDRAPQSVDARKGAWFIYREMVADDTTDATAHKMNS